MHIIRLVGPQQPLIPALTAIQELLELKVNLIVEVKHDRHLTAYLLHVLQQHSQVLLLHVQRLLCLFDGLLSQVQVCPHHLYLAQVLHYDAELAKRLRTEQLRLY